MARRRKSLFAQIIDHRRKVRAAREKENRRVQSQLLKEARARELADQRKREQDRLAAERRVRQAAISERRQLREQKAHALIELERSAEEQNHALGARLAVLSDLLLQGARRPPIPSLELERTLSREGADAFAERIEAEMIGTAYPEGVPAALRVLGYRPEARELVIERELPRDTVIPSVSEYRVVKGTERAVPRKPAEHRHLYGQLLARVTLRTIADAFAATPPTLVETIAINGRVTAVDRATGRTIHPHLLSVQFLRSSFDELVLDSPDLDPELCLRAQNALISPHPHDLEPVKPLLYYDLDRFKTIEGTDLLVDLDSRLDLLTLTPNEFENLIRHLFEARGLKSWQTQASRDDGIDAVAVNEDPVLGGLAIIQAKRYAKVVGYESVTALAGVMQDKAAAKGILVTTSWVGRASRDFAKRNGRIQIIDGRELKHLLAESLNMDVLISLPALPRDWKREEIA